MCAHRRPCADRHSVRTDSGLQRAPKRSETAIEEVADQQGGDVELVLEQEVAGVEQVQLCLVQIDEVGGAGGLVGQDRPQLLPPLGVVLGPVRP